MGCHPGLWVWYYILSRRAGLLQDFITVSAPGVGTQGQMDLLCFFFLNAKWLGYEIEVMIGGNHLFSFCFVL